MKGNMPRLTVRVKRLLLTRAEAKGPTEDSLPRSRRLQKRGLSARVAPSPGKEPPMIAPLLVVEIDGRPLRVFASPLYVTHRTADWPWHSTDDLRAVLRLPDDLSVLLLRRMRKDWGDAVRTVATPTGVTTIAPRHMGEGLIAAMQYRRRLLPTEDRRRIRGAFRNAMTAAMSEMLAHLPPEARLATALAAL